MRNNIPSCAAGLALVAALAGCSASKNGPFTDVTARDQQQASDVQPTTRPAGTADKPAPTISVTESTPATPAVVAPNPAEPKPVTIVVTDPATPATNTPLGKLVVRVDEQGRLSRDFGPSTFERPSGDVKAGPMYWPNRYRTVKRGDLENAVLEPVEFLLDSLLMPVRACITPPWTDVVYDAVPQDNTVPATVTDRQPVTQERQLNKNK